MVTRLIPILVICVLILGMSGCVDRGKCLKSHTETTLIPQYSYNNNQMQLMYFMPVIIDACDKWEYPEGRK